MPEYDAAKVDVWSIGMLLLIMVQGKYPFSTFEGGAKWAAAHALSKKLSEQVDAVHGVSDGWRAFVRSCFTEDAADRPTVAKLLADSWITSGEPYATWVRTSVCSRTGLRLTRSCCATCRWMHLRRTHGLAWTTCRPSSPNLRRARSDLQPGRSAGSRGVGGTRAVCVGHEVRIQQPERCPIASRRMQHAARPAARVAAVGGER